MKAVCISDNMDIAVGLKLAGINTIVLNEKNEIENKIKEISKDETIGIIFVTDKIYDLVKEDIKVIMQNNKAQLVARLPDKK